jgi:phosphatidylinositol alpha-mannosyltransferase
VKVGITCPYTWDVPGGVQAHVRDLADHLVALGHEVSVLTPVDDPDEADLPAYVVPAGRAVPVPYNGSVARLVFGPLSLARTRRWLRDGQFDVLHLHEPTVPSVSMMACVAADGPMVATFHTATARSRALQVFGTALQPVLEKLSGRIAVSPAARRVVVEHLGGDAVLIPNGVDVARFEGAQRCRPASATASSCWER